MGRQRTMARVHSPGSPAALAAEALAELNLGPGAVPHAVGHADGSAAKPSYPALAGSLLGAGDSAGPEPAETPPPLQRRQASVPPRPSSPQEYPSMRPGTAPPGSRRQAAEAALGALRSAAAPGGGSASASRGAAPYHAWSLMQLAGDAEGRRILWEVSRAVGMVKLWINPPASSQLAGWLCCAATSSSCLTLPLAVLLKCLPLPLLPPGERHSTVYLHAGTVVQPAAAGAGAGG